jgi:hypothetical protein
VKIVDATAKLADRSFNAQEILGGHGAKTTDEFRLDDLELTIEVLAAIGRLDGQRVPIAGRTATKDVEDIDVLALNFHPFDNDVGQQLAGPADERLAKAVFIGAGRLAAKNQSCIGISNAENRLGPRLR